MQPSSNSTDRRFENTAALTKYAYISGLVGVLFIHLLGFTYFYFDLEKWGIRLGSWKLTSAGTETILLILTISALAMALTELLIRIRLEKGNFISLSPFVKARKWHWFFIEWIYVCLAHIAILFILKIFFENALHYQFGSKESRYASWFLLLDKIFFYALTIMPVYLFFTRLLQYNERYDRKDPAYLLAKLMIWFLISIQKMLTSIFRSISLRTFFNSFVPKRLFHYFSEDGRFELNKNDGQIFLGILVKAFYVPLMTVFFFDQFNSLIKNYYYMANHMNWNSADYTLAKLVKDIYNISFTFIFVLDVGLAWSGYVFMSRWLKNGLKSVEPTFVGWAVALLCYPPFNEFLFFYAQMPSDKDFLSLISSDSSGWMNLFVITLAFLSLLSYFLYMSATIFFGLRFSNLTNRGIITTGWYKYIRHPAYAGKNIAWWLVFLPVILLQAVSKQSLLPLWQILALVIMTSLYYYRALTEEKHLSQDPEYLEYMKKVRYRFIPGIK